MIRPNGGTGRKGERDTRGCPAELGKPRAGRLGAQGRRGDQHSQTGKAPDCRAVALDGNEEGP